MTKRLLQDGRQKLALGERNALRKFCLTGHGFEAPSRWGRIGVASVRALVAKGLAVEGPASVYGPTFKLTEAGRRMLERIENPQRKRPAPRRSDSWAAPAQRISVTFEMPVPGAGEGTPARASLDRSSPQPGMLLAAAQSHAPVLPERVEEDVEVL